ncbi:hypothetical protein LIER_25710 [Lithospermum erythrorhizon]|uniref:Uncharacterized protein n=1 Tax=Lithospermum erythrorhizon TaxID=34254 RepID=A0AAV3R7U3_LITER
MPGESSQYQSSPGDEATNPYDNSGLSGEDVDAITSDIVPESSGRNHTTPVGGPDGKLALHSMRSKGLHERVHDETNRNGNRPSPLNIRISLNKKKDYGGLLQPETGSGLYPLRAPWDTTLWMQTQPVRAGLGKGRMLGAGYTSATEPLMHVGPSQAAPAPAAVMEDMRHMLAESEAMNKVLEQKYEEQQAANVDMKEEIIRLKSELANFMGMFQAYVGGAADAAGFHSPVRFGIGPMSVWCRE